MDLASQGLSKWFYLGIAGVILGGILISRAKGNNNSKIMENGYFILILGCIGIISEWTDFATVLLIFVLISGSILLFDKLILKKKRDIAVLKPHYVHYAREFFPIVLGVWVLRAFLFEAYQIPTSSMRPDLTVGDFILVNKFNYGIREPFTNKVILPIHKVNRGDVVIFKDQQVRNRDLIKRVIGIPGDKIEYYNKQLTINGVPILYYYNGTYDYTRDFTDISNVTIHTERYIEDLNGVKHSIITWNKAPSVMSEHVLNFKHRENCSYSDDNSGFTCIVPEGEYFMMGDNRDDSVDGRYWGFVPDASILGKAIYVWMNFHDFKRIGTKI